VSDFENSKKPYNGRLFLARHNEKIDDHRAKKMFGRAADLLNRKYDKDEIAKIAFRIVTGIGKHTTDNEYICSKFVDECFEAIGIEFIRD
jgi:hypothetical protein